MPNPIRQLLRDLVGIRDPVRRRLRMRTRVDQSVQVSATVFLILKRMRAPLITLILIFTVSVFGLTTS